MSFEDLIISIHNGVGTITINRPAKHNALREKTFGELAAAVAELESDPAVRVVVLTGAGRKIFCAGIDLDADGLPENSQTWDDHTRSNADVISSIWYCDKPVITALNGGAIAGGCNLAMVGDLTIAADSAFLSEPEIRHGALSPLLLLPWLMQFKGFNEMYLTGDRVEAERARELGLVNYVVPADELTAAAQKLAERVANAPGYALTLAKRAVRLSLDIQGFKAAQDAHRYIDTYMLASNGIVEKERLMSTLANEGMGAFLRARDTPYGER
jgi:enoyl-CoA hydratase/carnithine racemase